MALTNKKHYSIEVDHERKFIKYKHWGNLEPNDIGDVWQNEFLSRKEFTQLGYHLLSDYREATFQLPPAFIPELINFMKSIRHIVEGKKQSIIIEDPQSTAASLVFENQVNAEVGFRVKIFSTPQAALQWLIH